MASGAKQLPAVRPGEIITAAFLSDLARAVNQLHGPGAAAPAALSDGELFDAGATIDEGNEAITDARLVLPSPSHVWVESSRYEESVRVSNPDDPEQYVDVGRLRIVQSTNLKGEHEYRVFDQGTG